MYADVRADALRHMVAGEQHARRAVVEAEQAVGVAGRGDDLEGVGAAIDGLAAREQHVRLADADEAEHPAAARIGAQLGTCDAHFVDWQDDVLRGYGLLRPLPALDADALVAAMRLDKKVVAGRVKWVLPRRAGDVIITDDVPDEAVRAAAAWLARSE